MTNASPVRLLVALVLVVMGGVGCLATSGSSTASRTGPITQEDAVGSSARNAYDLVQNLRPQWLRGRGAQSILNPRPSPPVVYVEGIRESSLDALRRLDVTSILLIDYLGAADATTRYGTGHTGGAILVSLRR